MFISLRDPWYYLEWPRRASSHLRENAFSYPERPPHCYFWLDTILFRIRLLEVTWSNYDLRVWILNEKSVCWYSWEWFVYVLVRVGRIEFTAIMGKTYWFLVLNWNLKIHLYVLLKPQADVWPVERSLWRWLTGFWGREKSEQPVHVWYVRVVPKQGGRSLFCPRKQLLWNFYLGESW